MNENQTQSPTGDTLIAACPKCSATNAFLPVTVLRDKSDELKQLLAGRLNTVLCESCETEFLYETPILYRDDPQRWMVYFLPPVIVERLDDAILQVEELYDTVFDDLADDDRPGCRLATTRNAFIEKIAVHQRGLDDRIIEYVKYQLYQNCDDLDPIRHELLFDFSSSAGDQFTFLAFDRDTGKPTYSMEFPTADYESLATYFLSSEKMQGELNQMFRRHFVQVDDLI
jgi:hypothetical protein